MNNYVQAIRKSIVNKNWYAALALTMTLPDICGLLEYPELKDCSKKRYVNWFDKYMLAKYSSIGLGHVFLSGNDCYALRCSFLHQGEDDITSQKAREVLDSFCIIAPPTNGNSFHKIQSNTRLLLQIDIFCEDMCLGVEEWVKYITSIKPKVLEKFSTLLEIRDITYSGLSF